MKNIRHIKFVALICFFLAIAVPITAQEDGSLENNSSSVPDWLERTDFSVILQSDRKPRYYLQTIQPLYSSSDESRTVFTQGRLTYEDDASRYSLGFGLRELFNENWMGGVNSFFDFDDRHKHYRAGVGLELIGQQLEGRVNTYIGMSPRRKVGSTSTSSTFEEAVDGIDYEIGTVVPYLPWLKVFAGGEWYNFEKFDNKTGWKTRLEAKPSDYVTIDIFTFDDNKGDQEFGGEIAVNIPFETFSFKEIFGSTFQISPEPYEEIDLKERRLDPVERSFDITVEKYVQTSTMNIEIGRN